MGKNLFFGLSLILLLMTISGKPIIDSSDGVYSEISREMAAGGGWGLPRLNGEVTLIHPPLMHWVTAAFMKMFGVSEVTARLPYVLLLIFALFLVMKTALIISENERSGVLSASVLLTSLFFFMNTKSSLAGIASLSFFCLSVFSIYSRRMILFFISLGFSLMGGGLHGLIAGLILFCVYWVIIKDLKTKIRDIAYGLVLFAIISLPWFIHAASRTGSSVGSILTGWFFVMIPENISISSRVLSLVVLLVPWICFIPVIVSVYMEQTRFYDRKMQLLVLAVTLVVIGALDVIAGAAIPQEGYLVVSLYSLLAGISFDRFLKYDGSARTGIAAFSIGLVIFISIVFLGKDLQGNDFMSTHGFINAISMRTLLPVILMIPLGLIFVIYQRRELAIWGLVFAGIISQSVLSYVYAKKLAGDNPAQEISKFVLGDFSKKKIQGEVFAFGDYSPSLDFYLKRNVKYRSPDEPGLKDELARDRHSLIVADSGFEDRENIFKVVKNFEKKTLLALKEEIPPPVPTAVEVLPVAKKPGGK